MFEFHELFDNDEITAFIKKVEKQFRISPEYNIWLTNFTHRDIDSVTGMSVTDDTIEVEVHHYGHTLYEWVEIIVDKFLDNNLLVNSHYICLILSDIHLNRCVSYLPLMHDYHVKLHKVGEESFVEEYPQIRDYVYEGNYNKAIEIIDKHIEILKTISNNKNE